MSNPKKPAELSAEEKAREFLEKYEVIEGQPDIDQEILIHYFLAGHEAGFNSRTSEVEELVELLELANKTLAKIHKYANDCAEIHDLENRKHGHMAPANIWRASEQHILMCASFFKAQYAKHRASTGGGGSDEAQRTR